MNNDTCPWTSKGSFSTLYVTQKQGYYEFLGRYLKELCNTSQQLLWLNILSKSFLVVTMKSFGRTPININEAVVPKGEVFLLPERCKGCRICIQFCPREILREAKNTNAKGYHYPEIVPGKENGCVHCEFCTMVCPEFAIYTLEVIQ